jgi:hypothetical protein
MPRIISELSRYLTAIITYALPAISLCFQHGTEYVETVLGAVFSLSLQYLRTLVSLFNEGLFISSCNSKHMMDVRPDPRDGSLDANCNCLKLLST